MSVVATKDSCCYVCGLDNPFGLKVPFEQEGAEGSVARYIARMEHGGWNGILHGGVTFSLMDEALGWALFFQQKPSVTAKVTTRFNKPVPIGAPLVIRGWVVRERSRMIDARAEVRSDDSSNTLFAEADATMYLIPESNSPSSSDSATRALPL